MDGSLATSFLKQKRNWICTYTQETAEEFREGETLGGLWGETVGVHEECCIEGCNMEEISENTAITDMYYVGINMRIILLFYL